MENFNFVKVTGVTHMLRAVRGGLTAFSKLNGGLATHSPQRGLTANSAIKQDWQKVGNDMRIGILKYDRKQIKGQ
jgi:hypothetical protein